MRGHPAPPQPARQQGGVFSREQAHAAGYSNYQIRRAVSSGLWIAVLPGVWRPSSIALTTFSAVCASVLAGGLSSTASHDTAAAWWRYPVLSSARFHVLLPVNCHIVVPGLRTHRIPLAPGDVVHVSGIRVTSKVRTLVDCLTWWSEGAARTLAQHALRERIVTPRVLTTLLLAARPRHGASAALAAIADLLDGAHSEAEAKLHTLLRAAGISGWEANVPVSDAMGLIGIVDALFRQAALVVEVDGRRFHDTDDRFQSDRARDNRLQLLGFSVLHFTWDDLTLRPDIVIDQIREHLRHH